MQSRNPIFLVEIIKLLTLLLGERERREVRSRRRRGGQAARRFNFIYRRLQSKKKAHWSKARSKARISFLLHSARDLDPAGGDRNGPYGKTVFAIGGQ